MQQYMHVARQFSKPWQLLSGLLLCFCQPVAAQELQLSVETIEFPVTFIGDFSEAIISYENVGDAPITFEKIDFSDPDQTTFEIVNSPSLAIMDPGDVRNIRVRFTPSEEQTVNTFLVVETLVPDARYRVSLSGTGQVERLRLSFEALTFSPLEASSVKDTTLVLENPSDAPVTITAIGLTALDQSVSILAGDAPGTLLPGATREVDIRFAPQLPGIYETALTIQIAQEAADRTVPITATGIAGTFTFTREMLEFESTILLDTSQKRIQFTNTSPVPLIVTGYSLTGPQATSFEITQGPTTPLTIIRGDRPEIEINFIPQMPGLNEASVVVQTNAQAEPFVLPISGDSRAGIASLSSTALAFNRLPVGSDTTASLTITNTGFAPFTISDVIISGTDAAGFSIATAPITDPIAPNDERVLTIGFAPLQVNEHTATLAIYTGLPDAPAEVSLSGLGGLDNSFVDAETPATDAPLDITVRKSGTEVWNTQTLYFRRGGEAAYQSIPMLDRGDQLDGQIPQAFITPRGVDYYVELINSTNILTIPTVDPALNPFHLQVQSGAIQSPAMLPAEKNQMISIPLLLDAPMLADILEDDYGGYNNRAWRLHSWNPATGAYEEYDEQDFASAPGKAFWLVTREGTPFDVGSGRSVPASEPFALALAPGWNQIANPYAFPIDWARSMFTADPGMREQIATPVAFDGDEYRYDETVLQPWNGYFVFNDSDDSTQIFLRPIEATPAISAGKNAAATTGLRYQIQLSASMPDFGLIDTQNFIGFSEAETATYQREAPPLDDHVRISIQSPEGRLASHFRPINDAGAYWDIELSSTITNNMLQLQQRVVLSMRALGSIPADFDVQVIDQTNGQVLPLSDSTWTFVLSEAQPVRLLRFVIGNQAFADEYLTAPATAQPFALGAGYPNPFSNSITLPYSLEASGYVQLTVFDLLGRRVATLVDGEQAAGAYQVNWAGNPLSGPPVASGVYIVQLRAGAFSAVKRIVLSR